jgi:hypothetical protein
MAPRSVNFGNYSTEIRIIKQDVSPARWSWTDPGIFEGAHADLLGWISASDKKYNIIYGYVLSKWPNLARALKGWPKNASNLPPIIFGPASTRMFVDASKTFFITNSYTNLLLGGVPSIVVVYTVTPDEPDDVCYFQMNWAR